MIHREKERARSAEAVLKKAGFTVSQICCSRPSCFDIAARKSKSLIFIKVQPDIRSISASSSSELKAISKCMSGVSLFISEKSREKTLEDDTIYSRYNQLAVTLKTFENIVLHNVQPLIQANPGGYYVEVDGEAIKRRRQELGLSIGEMAEMVGISRRTLYGYERGMAKASVTVAYNLVYALGVPVVNPIKHIENSKIRQRCFLKTAGCAIVKNKLLQRIFRKLARYKFTAVKKAPFDFIISFPEEKAKVIGGVADDKEEELHRRVDEILSVSKIVQAYPVLVVDKPTSLNKDISCINSEKLSKLKDPQDLLKA